ILPPHAEVEPTLLEPPLSQPARRKLPSISGDETRPVVLLLYTNALHRAEVARGLVRDGFEVRLIGSLAELVAADDDRAAPTTTVVVDMEHPDAAAALGILADTNPEARFIVCAPTAVDALDAVRALFIERFEIYVKASPLNELEASVRRGN